MQRTISDRSFQAVNEEMCFQNHLCMSNSVFSGRGICARFGLQLPSSVNPHLGVEHYLHRAVYQQAEMTR